MGRPVTVEGRHEDVHVSFGRRFVLKIGWCSIGLALWSASGCGLINPPAVQPPAPAASDAGGYAPTVPAPTRVRGVCIDPSASTIPDFAQSVRNLLADTVANWGPPPPAATTTTALEPRPGLELELRSVATNSYGSQNPYTAVSIQGVPGLAARPDVRDPGFSEEDPVWGTARDEVVAGAQTADQEAREGADKIRAHPLETSQSSEIAGCVSALAETLPKGSRGLVLASDLEQNEPPQVGGDLADTRVLVIQPCGGDAARCAQLQDQWQRELSARGAPEVRFIRPERALSELPTFLREEP
jgi:hypothetical protein